MDTSTAVVVLGMHRSGTSALAGMLSLLGIQFGRSLLPSHADNPRGYWEHKGIVDLNDRILAALGSSWDDMRLPQQRWWTDERVTPFRTEVIRILCRDFARERLWGLKDPRLCRLVPLWYDMLDDLGCRTCFVLIHRHPLEVAYSLRQRNGFDLRKSGLLWLEHNLLSERWTRGHSRIFASYDQIVEQPEAMFIKVSKMIGRSDGAPTKHQMDAVRGFITPDLRHHRSVSETWGAEFGEYRSLIEKTYHKLSTTRRDDTPCKDQDLDQVFEDYQSITSRFDPVLTAHSEDLAFRIGELRNEIGQMASSTSWKMTKPLRGVIRLAHRIGWPQTPK